MEYRLMSQIFAVIDLVGCAIILGICAILGYIITYQTVSQNAPQLDSNSLWVWVIYGVLVLCCYIIIDVCIDLFRATQKNQDPGKVFGRCFHWLALSWISFVLGGMQIIIGISSRFLEFPILLDRLIIIPSYCKLFTFLSFTILRGMALFCIHKYMHQQQTSLTTETSVPLIPVVQFQNNAQENSHVFPGLDSNQNSVMNTNYSPGYNLVPTEDNLQDVKG